MIWLVGNKGLLGTDVEIALKIRKLPSLFSDKEVDITSISCLEDFTRDKEIDWIINCAAYTNVDQAEKEENVAREINSLGVLNLAKIAKEKNSRIIHISTDYVFDGCNLDIYTETDTTNPQTAYGRSKLEGEIALLNTYEKHFIIRTSWLFGKYGNNFVYTMLRLFNEKASIQVVDDQTGSPTYSKDLANAILKIIEDNSTSYGIYHYSNRGKTDWYEFAYTILTLTMSYIILPRYFQAFIKINPITTSEYKTNAKRPENSYLDTTKFEQVFCQRVRSWKEALEEFLGGLKK